MFNDPFFEKREPIGENSYQIEMRKQKVVINRPYQCGIAVYQLAKLKMLEFYHDFVDRFFDRRDFELIQMDTDSLYMAISSEKLSDLVKPSMKDEYEKEVLNYLVTRDEFSRTPGLFKEEFTGFRMIALTSKCLYAENNKGTKISCKGVNKSQNTKLWDNFYDTLFSDYIDKAENVGFRRDKGRVVTYTQSKLGLSGYYDKRVVLEDNVHTKNLF